MKLVELLQRCHDLLDDTNADGGGPKPLCKYCSAVGYGGDGIEHRDYCVIVALRHEIEARKNPNVQDPPFDDSEPCPACPSPVRNLTACVHNYLGRLDEFGKPLPGANILKHLESLRSASSAMDVISQRHFADPMHSLGRVPGRSA